MIKRFEAEDGLTLAYRDGGAGLPVLCLPGLSRNGLDFDPLVGLAGPDTRLIRLDPRGRGASEYDPDFHRYSVEVETRDSLDLLDHLGLERAAIIGTSRGGILAMAMALAAPERIAAVMMNDIGPDIEAEGVARILTYLGKTPAYADLDAAATDVAELNRSRFTTAELSDWRTYLGNAWEETADGLRLRYDPKLRDAFIEQMNAAPLPDLWPFYDALPDVPLAVLRGANSDVLSQETAEEMARRRPGLALTVVPGRGHVPFLTEPESVAAVAAFVARCRG